jgi:[ribosomal protein S5]-alanine N-acetyltransferase
VASFTGLRTPRLLLRQLRADDLDALKAVLQDDVAMSAYEGGLSDRECADWLARQQERYAADGFGLWAVVENATGEVIGDAGITRQLVESDPVLEVGYHLRRDRWGLGFATEAARACVDWCFAALDPPEVYAKIRDTNTGSMNVAIRLGMTVRRRFTVHYRGIDMPHYAFAVSREQWRGRAPQHPPGTRPGPPID